MLPLIRMAASEPGQLELNSQMLSKGAQQWLSIVKSISSEAIDKVVDELKKTEHQIDFKQMVVKEKSVAERIVEVLKAGEDFDKLAQTKSIDKGQRVNQNGILERLLPPEIRDLAVGGLKVIPVQGHYMIELM